MGLAEADAGMLGQHHVLIGCTALVAVQATGFPASAGLADVVALAPWSLEVPQTPFLLAAAAVGSLLPDVDHPRAMLNNFSPLLRVVFFVPALLLRHRGPTHALLVWAALTLLALVATADSGFGYLALAASLGWLLHLAADALTVAGVPLLWPLYRHPVGFPPNRHLRFPTGGTREYVVVALFVAWVFIVARDSGWTPLVSRVVSIL